MNRIHSWLHKAAPNVRVSSTVGVQGTVTTRLEGALSQENVGQVYQRRMRIEGGALVIVLDTATPEGEPIVRTLRWRREA